MGQSTLETIRLQVHAGDREGARLALADLLKAEPDNADVWALLAILVKEPDEQAECYRQILRIDPGNRQAAMWLEMLTRPAAESPVGEGPSVAETQHLEPLPGESSRPDMLFGDLVLPGNRSLGRTGVVPSRPAPLSPGEILELAGGPLAPEERRRCPTCLAVVSRTELKCPWCSAPLPPVEDS
jgi:hypothetical protein